MNFNLTRHIELHPLYITTRTSYATAVLLKSEDADTLSSVTMFSLRIRSIVRPSSQYVRQSQSKVALTKPATRICQQRHQSTQIGSLPGRPQLRYAQRNSLSVQIQRRYKSKHTAKEAFTILFKAHPYAMTTWVIV